MSGTEPIPHQETEQTHEQDFSALKEVSRTIDEILADDTEGKRTGAANYNPYGEKPTRQVGDRYGEKVSRTSKPEGTTYSAGYAVKIEAPQPDSTKESYNPYDFRDVKYTWDVDPSGDVTNVSKNETGSKTALTAEQIENAMTDINKLISDGLQNDTLTADSIDESAAQMEATTEAPRRESTVRKLARKLLGR